MAPNKRKKHRDKGEKSKEKLEFRNNTFTQGHTVGMDKAGRRVKREFHVALFYVAAPVINMGNHVQSAYIEGMKAATNIMPQGPESFKRALEILRAGGLVALPTETVYGLAADASNDAAVAKVYALKGRPSHNPLIAHVLSPEWAHDLAHVNDLARKLMEAFWPGPLTLVLPRKTSELSDRAGGWLPTIAVRCPDADWAKAFANEGWSSPLFMPSANLSGRISPTTAAHVAADFGEDIELILDGGPCRGGVESTVLEIHDTYAVLLRPGTIAADDFAPYLSDLRLPQKRASINAPGMLASHYAPRAKMRLGAQTAKIGEAYMGFGDIAGELNLSPKGDTAEAARNLYDYMRRLDRPDVKVIAVAPIPNDGLGEAINDRLRRAAAER